MQIRKALTLPVLRSLGLVGTLTATLTLTLVACGQSDSLTVEEQDNTEVYVMAMPGKDGEVRDTDHGLETWFAYGALKATEGHHGSGVAHAHVFEDGHFIHTAQFNIERPEDGYFYEGWLVHPETKRFISTGHMKSHFGDVRHSLRFSSDVDMRAYTKVVITLEPDDGDPAPAKHVGEGTLKETKR